MQADFATGRLEVAHLCGLQAETFWLHGRLVPSTQVEGLPQLLIEKIVEDVSTRS